MCPTRRSVLSTVATASVALAGCIGGNGGNGGSPSPTSTPTSSPTGSDTPTGSTGSGATVQVRSHPDYGDILVGPEGLTLYMFDKDTKGDGASACYDSCAQAWPPLTASSSPMAGEGVTAQLTTFEREGGKRQVAAGGWPLYYFASDENPGDAKGQGVNDVWWVLAPDGTPVMSTGTTTETSGGTPTETSDGGADGGAY